MGSTPVLTWDEPAEVTGWRRAGLARLRRRVLVFFSGCAGLIAAVSLSAVALSNPGALAFESVRMAVSLAALSALFAWKFWLLGWLLGQVRRYAIGPEGVVEECASGNRRLAWDEIARARIRRHADLPGVSELVLDRRARGGAWSCCFDPRAVDEAALVASLRDRLGPGCLSAY